MISETELAANLTAVRTRIADAARSAGRDPAQVTLVAVGKVFPAEVMRTALAAGQRVFGENRVQEAAAKWPPQTRLEVLSGADHFFEEHLAPLREVIVDFFATDEPSS